MNTQRIQIPILHGYRALFVALVANFHIWQQSWMHPYIASYSVDFLARAGYVFVDGMVLLSALLLFIPYAQSLLYQTELPCLQSYYVKKAARILPGYYAFIIPLFAYMLWQGRYFLSSFAVKDILLHVFLFHTFDAFTYFGTNLGAGLWTIVILVQGYIVMPFFAKAILKKPWITLLCMFALGNIARLLVLQSADVRMYMNQLPTFLDTYALGFLLALFFAKACKQEWQEKLKLWQQVMASIVLVLCVFLCVELLRFQASSEGHAMLMVNQIKTRLPFTLLFAIAFITTHFALPFIRFIFSNKVVLFLSAVSYNFYICHQVLAVELRIQLFNTEVLRADRGLQMAYTLLCWALALLLSMFMTYCIEKPAAKWILHLYQRRTQK